MSTLMTASQIFKTIKDLTDVQDWSNHKVHVVLCHATIHAVTVGNGDVTAFEKLIRGMKGGDRKSMLKWIRDFAPVNFDKDGKATCNKTKRKAMAPGGPEEVSLDFLLESTKWFDYAPSVREILADFDLEKHVLKQIEKAEELEIEGKRKVVNAGLASYLQTAMIRYYEDQREGAIAPAAEEEVRLAA